MSSLTRVLSLTFVEYIAHRAVVQDHDLAEIGLHLGQILDVGPVAEGAVLAVVAAAEVRAFSLEPVDYWVGVFLHGCGEDDEAVPL